MYLPVKIRVTYALRFDSSWPCPRLSPSCPGSCTCWRKSWRKKRCVERHVRLPEPPHPPSRSRWWGKYLREFLFIWARVFVERVWDDILERLCVYPLLKHHSCYCPFSVAFRNVNDFCLRDKKNDKIFNRFTPWPYGSVLHSLEQ